MVERLKRSQPQREVVEKRPDTKAADKRMLFARHYVLLLVNNKGKGGSVIREAAIQAGAKGTSAVITGSKWLTDPNVKAEIARLQARHNERLDLSTERLLKELARVGYASMRDFVRVDEDGQPHLDLSDLEEDDWAAIGELTTETYWEGKGAGAREVKRTKWKLHDKLGALDKLAKHHGLYKQGQGDEHITNNVQNVEYTLKIGNANIIVQAEDQGDLLAATSIPKARSRLLPPKG